MHELADWLNTGTFWRAYFWWDLEDESPGNVSIRPASLAPPPGSRENLSAMTDLVESYKRRRNAMLDRIFGPEDPAVMGRLFRNITIPLSFPGGFTWHIMFDASPSIQHSLNHPSWPNAIELGFRDPHFKLPILRFEEVKKLATHLPPRERPLLHSVAWLAPSDDRQEIVRLLLEHWHDANILPVASTGSLVQHLLFRSTVDWELDPAYGFVNDGPRSVRNPKNSSWNRDTFGMMNRFLVAAGAA